VGGVRSQESGVRRNKEERKKERKKKKEEERNFLPPAPCLFYVRPRKKT
jgi:hypothetical protein